MTGAARFMEVSCEVFGASCGGSGLASYYASTLGPAGRYLAAFRGGSMIGYAICAPEGDGRLFLASLFVKEECRRQGVAARLLEEVESLCRIEGGTSVRCCLPGEADNAASLRAFFERRGYLLSNRLFVFRCGELGAPNYRGWERYMEKRGGRALRRLEAGGFSAQSLEEAGDELMASLRELSARSRDLDISALLDGRRGRLSRRVSCVTVKDGRAVAFSICSEPDDVSILFEQLGVAPELRNTGAILPALSASIYRCRDFGCERVLYAAYESNKPALAMAMRTFSSSKSAEKVQYYYSKQIAATRERVILKG